MNCNSDSPRCSHECTSLLDECRDPSRPNKDNKDTCDRLFPIAKQLLVLSLGVLLGMVLTRRMSNEVNSEFAGIRGNKVDYHEPALMNASDFQVKSTNSKYTSFQALNFQLYTGGALITLDKRGTLNPECSGHLAPEGMGEDDVMQCYMGHENVTEDILDRLAIMESALDRAYEVSLKDPSTLKVFVAPEFFFRGKNGAYLVDETASNNTSVHVFGEVDGKCSGEICHILEGLEDMVAQKKFEDWIFLFGTMILSEKLPVEDTYDYLFYNFGMLYKGYDPKTTTHHGKRFLVPKRYISMTDFLNPARAENTQEIFETARQQNIASAQEDQALYPMGAKYDRELWYKYKNELTKWDYIMIEYGWLKVDGLTLTVEICLDHDLRMALNAFLVDSVLPAPTLIPSSQDGKVKYVEIPRHQAQLSIVSSAGMEAAEESLVLAHTGSIILQDGLSDAAPSMQRTFECDKFVAQFAGGAEVIQRNATLTPTEAVFSYHIQENYKKIPVFDGNWKKQLKGVFSNSSYEPMITAFQSMPIAKIF